MQIIPNLNPLDIFHFNSLYSVNEAQVNSVAAPLVIINCEIYNKHIQIKVAPFNYANSDKASLSFAEKMQYFSQSIRKAIQGGTTVIPSVIAANVEIVLPPDVDSLNYFDGIEQELAEFNTGFTLKPATAFGGNIAQFFNSFFLNISPISLAEFTAEFA